MGNSLYKSNCKYDFFLDHESQGQNLAIVAGNHLRGKVTIQVLQTLPPTTIELRLAGKEKAAVHVQSGKNARTCRGERQICSATTILRRQASGSIQPGTYVFPFDISLPVSLPSTMWESMKSRSNCFLEYKLKIDATPEGKAKVRGISQRGFAVASYPLPDRRVPAAIGPKSINVGGLLGSRGKITIAARVLDVQVGRGSNLEIFLACRNYTSATIHRVEVTLTENVFWRVDNHRHKSKQRVVARLGEVDLPGILRGKQTRSHVAETRGIIPQEELSFLHEELQSQRNKVVLKVPLTCLDSRIGKLIQVRHEIHIQMFTKSGLSNPSVVIPLEIGFPPIPSRQRREAFPRPSQDHEAIATPIETPAAQNNASVRAVQIFDPSTSLSSPLAYAEPLHNASFDSTPIAEAFAIPIDENAVQAPVAFATHESLILGGAPIVMEDTEDTSREIVTPYHASSVPFQSPRTNSEPISFAVLLEEMALSIDDFFMLEYKLGDPRWVAVLAEISPEQLGTMLCYVNRDIDQPRVVELLAREAFKERFTCEYGRAAVENTAEWNKATMVRLILPHCVDVRENYNLIQSVLSEWMKTVTRSYFVECAGDNDGGF